MIFGQRWCCLANSCTNSTRHDTNSTPGPGRRRYVVAARPDNGSVYRPVDAGRRRLIRSTASGGPWVVCKTYRSRTITETLRAASIAERRRARRRKVKARAKRLPSNRALRATGGKKLAIARQEGRPMLACRSCAPVNALSCARAQGRARATDSGLEGAIPSIACRLYRRSGFRIAPCESPRAFRSPSVRKKKNQKMMTM